MSESPDLQAWVALLARVFPIAVPDRGGWSEPNAIRAVLGAVAAADHVTSCTPDQRPTRLRGVTAGTEPGTLELSTDEARYLVRPRNLTLETFEGHALTYLRLSALALGPGVADAPMALAEHNRVRVGEGQAFVWFSQASPLARLTVAPELGTWSSRDLRQYVEELQSTMQMQTT